MAMTTLGEASAVNAIIRHLTRDAQGRPLPTRGQAVDALVLLAGSAHAKLSAGYSAVTARLTLQEGWPQREDAEDEGPRCVLCGCTEENGCEGGCEWADTTLMADLCTQCVCRVARDALSSGLYQPDSALAPLGHGLMRSRGAR